jgi:hypothetical protein
VKNDKHHLLKIEAELIEGKKVLKQEKQRVKKAKTKLEKKNGKRALKTVEKAVESIEYQRDLLEETAVDPPEADKSARSLRR